MSLTVRQRAAIVLRKFWLLQLADQLLYVYLRFRLRKTNRIFRSKNPDVRIPPASILYDILGTCDLMGFFQSGREHANALAGIISKNQSHKSLQILEWGCGPGRVLQYLQSPSGDNWELSGADYNPRTIDWCRTNLPKIRFFHNDLAPPIPAKSASFDVIYCISVYTHLSEPLHYQWIHEILRLLKPGGLFIGTFHGERYRNHLEPEEQRRFDAGHLVVRDRIREGKKNFAAYHPDDFVRSLLSSFGTVWSQEEPGFQQTVWCGIKGTEQV
jgi:SAM-dependent methyltransferase